MQLAQRFLIDAFTFMLQTSRDPTLAAILVELDRDLVSYEYLDPVQAHFTGQIRKYCIAPLKCDLKKGVWESLFDYSGYFVI